MIQKKEFLWSKRKFFWSDKKCFLWSDKKEFYLPSSRSCPGQVASSSNTKSIFWKNLPQAAKLPGTSGVFKKHWFLAKVLPQAAKLPGTSGFFKKHRFSGKSSAPGSEAARGKWLLNKKMCFWKNVLAQGARLPGTSGFFKKKVDFLAKKLPQAAKLPGTSGVFNFIFELPIHRPGGRFVTT